ncbi:hypothetical protein J4421_04235 [Candidatus Woesearchaeota archaeon]|nr:hypothetical protein [Candidatus Woesearchaeota archaeon]
MNLLFWFRSRKPWLRGGLIGICICLLLFPFYIFIYFPIINNVYADEIKSYGSTPGCTTIIPLLTGHFIPLISHFLVEGSSVITLFCEAKEPHCTSWAAKEIAVEEGFSCIPWILDSGESGCCQEKILTPTAACSERVE